MPESPPGAPEPEREPAATEPRFVVPVADLLRTLRTDPSLAPNIEAVREHPARGARTSTWPPDLAREAVTAAAALGIDAPYLHQARAIEMAIDPDGPPAIAVVTGTASGKSACYTLPLAHAALRAGDRGSRALLLFPTKALAQDQLAALHAWDAALSDAATALAPDPAAPPLASDPDSPRIPLAGGSHANRAGEPLLAPATYDGDTPSRNRAAVRREARLVLTNPEMLHTGILPHHAAWHDFLAGVGWVVIDEMHVYRGIFGSHVANVIRRLQRVCRFHGASPRFILTSATIANPAEHAHRLTGLPAAIVDADGAPRGRRTFVFYNPPLVDETLGVRRSAILEAERIARHFLEGGVQTIAFARTRQTAELLMRYIGEGMGDDGRIVRAYRGGYTVSERRAIEAALREGRLRGVVATSALELGIDIGDLDACVLAGYPGTIASTWQRAGRAGRRLGDAAAVLVAGPGPLDQYIARHPETIMDRSPEHARIDPDNLLILLDHIRCAAFELPFEAEEAERPFGAEHAAGSLESDGPFGIETASSGLDEADRPFETEDAERPVDADPPFGAEAGVEGDTPSVAALLAVLEARGEVRTAGSRWYWSSEDYPSAAMGLRDVGGELVTIVRDAGGRGGDGDGGDGSRPDVLGTVDRGRAPTAVHPGAIYLHAGRAWRVEALDWEAGRAMVVPSDGATYTLASSRVDVLPTRIAAEAPAAGASRAYGELEITERATGFREIRFRTHETIGWGSIDLPERRHAAGGYWFTLDDETVEALRAIGRWRPERPDDRGPNWPAQRERARSRDGARCRLCGSAERPDRQHDVHHIRPFHDFGWRPGVNDAYLEANALENLVTLCQACHSAAERALGLQGALTGLAYALAHLAPLVLMCDVTDLGVTTESLARWSGKPTVIVYERAAGGVGFGEVLFGRHDELMRACLDLVEGCRCAAGCPGCIGPVEAPGAEAKAHTLDVLRRLV